MPSLQHFLQQKDDVEDRTRSHVISIWVCLALNECQLQYYLEILAYTPMPSLWRGMDWLSRIGAITSMEDPRSKGLCLPKIKDLKLIFLRKIRVLRPRLL